MNYKQFLINLTTFNILVAIIGFMMKYAKLYYISLWVVYACCMAIPFLLENQKERINAVSNGNLGHVLKSSLV